MKLKRSLNEFCEENMKKPLVILTGPTAVGKTELSIKLAQTLNGEIISADSMQVYKKMDIGTAKILPEQMSGIKHYLIDEFEPDEAFNVVKFKAYATKYMNEIYKKGKVPIIVGGTGFYIQAVLYDIAFEDNNTDKSYRKELELIAKEQGATYLFDMLKRVDEPSAIAIHPNNIKKVIRALEYFYQTGQKISAHNEVQKAKESPYNFIYFVLNNQRDLLYEKINHRIDIMIEKGLVNEVRSLYQEGYSSNLVSMQGLGYKEILSYLENECSLDEAIYTLKRDTRHFAKRQITWFKREKEVAWINKNEFEEESYILKAMLVKIKERGIQ
jgi:tRNA dimethylallyltransferase